MYKKTTSFNVVQTLQNITVALSNIEVNIRTIRNIPLQDTNYIKSYSLDSGIQFYSLALSILISEALFGKSDPLIYSGFD